MILSVPINLNILQEAWIAAHTFIPSHDLPTIPRIPKARARAFLTTFSPKLESYLEQFNRLRNEPSFSLIIRQSLGARFLPSVLPIDTKDAKWLKLFPFPATQSQKSELIPWSLQALSFPLPRRTQAPPSPSTALCARISTVSPSSPLSADDLRQTFQACFDNATAQMERLYQRRAFNISKEIRLYNLLVMILLDVATHRLMITTNRANMDELGAIFREFQNRDFALRYVGSRNSRPDSLAIIVSSIPFEVLRSFPTITDHFASHGYYLQVANSTRTTQAL